MMILVLTLSMAVEVVAGVAQHRDSRGEVHSLLLEAGVALEADVAQVHRRVLLAVRMVPTQQEVAVLAVLRVLMEPLVLPATLALVMVAEEVAE